VAKKTIRRVYEQNQGKEISAPSTVCFRAMCRHVSQSPRNSQRLNKEARFDEIDDILDALEDVELPSRKPATNSRLVRHQT
jgi:hypothetical protein